MLNQDKSILVAYIDIRNINKEKGIHLITQVNAKLNSLFANKTVIDDDSLVIITLPADRTEIVLLNAKYPNYEQIKKDAEKLLEDYINK